MELNGYWKIKTRAAHIRGLDFNRHNKYHLARAAQEGIVFSLIYGAEIMQEMGLGLQRDPGRLCQYVFK